VRPILEYGSVVTCMVSYNYSLHSGILRSVQRTFYGFMLNIPLSIHENGLVALRFITIDDWLNADVRTQWFKIKKRWPKMIFENLKN